MNSSGSNYMGLEGCEYLIKGEEECGEPAVYLIWWENPDLSISEMSVCQEHFDSLVGNEGGEKIKWMK